MELIRCYVVREEVNIRDLFNALDQQMVEQFCKASRAIADKFKEQHPEKEGDVHIELLVEDNKEFIDVFTVPGPSTVRKIES